MTTRRTHRVRLDPGDGIGPEVIGTATEVVAAADADGRVEPTAATCGPKNTAALVEGEHLAR